MAASQDQVREMLRDYVKTESMADHLKEYVLKTAVEEVAVTKMSQVALEKLQEMMATEETKNKVEKLAETIVTELTKQGNMALEEKLIMLTSRVESLEDNRQPTQDVKQSEDEKADEEEDVKDKRINELENKLKELNELNENKSKEGDKDHKVKEKTSITKRREFLYLPNTLENTKLTMTGSSK